MILRNFQHDPVLRGRFNTLARAQFDIDFEAWYQEGFWDGSYACLAWAEEDRMLATLGVSNMDLWIDGVSCRATQIGTVMTHPDHRGQGLSSRLMDEALAGVERAFLFAGQGAKDFYPRFGFRQIHEYEFWMKPNLTESSARTRYPLQPDRPGDLILLEHMARTRTPVSRRLSVQAPWLLLWYFFNLPSGTFSHVPEEDLIVVGIANGTTFHLYDVISPCLPSWETLQGCLPMEGVDSVLIHFTPDLIAPRAECRRASDEDLLFVRGDFPLGDQPFHYPLTGRT